MSGAFDSMLPERGPFIWLNRLRARLDTLSAPETTLTWQPAPRWPGNFDRGKLLCEGRFQLRDRVVDIPGASIWDLPQEDPEIRNALHGFVWLDDLAAVADGPARRRARDWTHDWVSRYGRGPDRSPEETGRRLMHLLPHAGPILGLSDAAHSRALLRALGQQARFLARRWSSAPPGRPRFTALAGLIRAALSLSAAGDHLGAALAAIGAHCDEVIDDAGGLPTRNPEDLLEVFILLTMTAATLTEAGQDPGAALQDGIARIAPTLRALRHADGALARFHGGDCGGEGVLDRALADARIRPTARPGLAMGYARLAAGRTTVIVDAAQPPAPAMSENAHASTLAFELTSGRRPVIVNWGAGHLFGADWHRAGRATPSHSTLAIEGYSSSRLGPVRRRGAPALLIERPGTVVARQEAGLGGHSLTVWHDGYSGTHGLTHVRQLLMARDGRSLGGEDTLAAFSDPEREVFERMRARMPNGWLPFTIRFHLHPDVAARRDPKGAAVALTLKSGETWIFRHDGAAKLALEPGVYLDPRQTEPRATKQVVLSADAMDYASVIKWSLAKTPGSLRPPRDLDRDDHLGD
ncbi:Heparinase II/III-like [Rhodovulum sp. P5]|uniref:heparinase II/III family protein n=1 Tax=Rhodovulum sp. P5 TaxID=1564506 RepID=UPI0009C3147F|nr:heparinase II/III family protein [Rhodovulum sp. P5]ARE40468.1 Heparinase II/III-like [Rhodovulum sp. P5]